MKPDEIKRIAELAKGHGERILDRWLPGGKSSGGRYHVRNPLRGDEHLGNMSVVIATGLGGDHAVSEHFRDYVGLVAFAQQCGMSEAAEALAEFLGISAAGAVPPAPTFTPSKPPAATWRPIVPVPADAPPPPKAHSKRGRPSAVYEYRNGTAALLGYVWRHEANPPEFPRKDFYPLTWCTNGSRSEWRHQSWPAPRPLYGLDLMAARPSDIRVGHEGEKSADAGRELLPDYVSFAWPNGSGGADKADFSPLAGCDVLLWPDNDAAGRKAMRTAAKAMRKIGVRSVKFINVVALFGRQTVDRAGRIVERLEPLPKGWDCADAYAEGWQSEQIASLLLNDDALLSDLPEDEAEAPAGVATDVDEPMKAGPYLLDDELGLFYVETDKDGRVRQSRLCGPLAVIALARDADGGSWAVVLDYKDRDGKRCREVIAFSRFLGDGVDGIKQLADMGLEIASGRQSLDRLKSYIVGAHPEQRAKLVDQTGWHGQSFAFPEGTIGETDETLLFRGSRRTLGVYATRGSLTDWQNHIANPAIGNPRLMFCLSVAFAGPLLKIVGAASMVFHLVGDSSIGKSGALTAAGSVWGSPEAQLHSWRATSNALEYTAAQHNDCLLILDELKEVDAKEAAAIAYMLTNAKGKGRAHHSGGLREGTSWRLSGLSSGELGMGDHLASAGQKHHAGQQVRFIEIAADAGAGHGMWCDVGHRIDGGKQFTDMLKKFAGRYHGTAGRAFVAALVKELDHIPALWRQHDLAFAEDYKPTNAGGQVLRVMASFSLAAFAGELAAKWQIVPWPVGAATAAAGSLFDEWVKERPTKGNSEEAQIIAHVRNILERTWQSRFIDWARATGRRRILDNQDAGDFSPDLSRMALVHDALGFRREEIPFDADRPSYLFYVTRQRFADEFAAKGGFKPKRVASLLKARGVLNCDPDSTTLRETLPSGDPRSYCIIGSKLWALE
ncbi:hypothetical protein MASR1M60_14990 [Rhodocyclaceae bacterium]